MVFGSVFGVGRLACAQFLALQSLCTLTVQQLHFSLQTTHYTIVESLMSGQYNSLIKLHIKHQTSHFTHITILET